MSTESGQLQLAVEPHIGHQVAVTREKQTSDTRTGRADDDTARRSTPTATPTAYRHRASRRLLPALSWLRANAGRYGLDPPLHRDTETATG